MPAGYVNVNAGGFETGPKVAFLQAGPPVPYKLPKPGKAWSRVLDRLAKAVTSPKAAGRALTRGVGMSTAIRSTASALGKAALPVAVAIFSARVIGRVATKFMATAVQIDAPGIQEAQASFGRLGVRIIESVGPALERAVRSDMVGAVGLGLVDAVTPAADLFLAVLAGVGDATGNAVMESVVEAVALRVAALRVTDPDDLRRLGAIGSTGPAGMLSVFARRYGPEVTLAAIRALKPELSARLPAMEIRAGRGAFTSIAAETRRIYALPDVQKIQYGIIDLRGMAVVREEYRATLVAFVDRMDFAAFRFPVSLEAGVASALDIGMTGFRNLAATGGTIGETLRGVQAGAEDLNASLLLGVNVVGRVFGQSIISERLRFQAEMAYIGAMATFNAIEAGTKAAAEFVMGDIPAGLLHSAAASAYAATAVMAGAARPPRITRDDLGLGDDIGGRVAVGREAVLYVQAPGYVGVDELARMIERGINSDAPIPMPSTAYPAFSFKTGSAALDSLEGIGRQIERGAFVQVAAGAGQIAGEQAGAALGYALGTLGPVGYAAGVALGLVFGDEALGEIEGGIAHIGGEIADVFGW